MERRRVLSIVVVMAIAAILAFSMFLVTLTEASAGSWSSPERIGSGSGNYTYVPSLAENSAGTEIVAWSELNIIDLNSTVWANLYSPSSGWTGAVVLSNASRDVGMAVAGIDENGLCTVVWTDGSSVLSRDYNPTLGWQATETITNATDGAYGAMLAVAPTGDAMALWYNLSSGGIFTSYRPAGSTWMAPTPFFSGASDVLSYLDMAIDGQGNVTVAFTNDNDMSRMWATRYIKGVGWDAGQAIEQDPGPGYAPSVSANSAGDVLVVWQQFEGSQWGTCYPYANMYSPEDGWGSATKLETELCAGCDSPNAAMGDDGTAVSAWRFVYTGNTGADLHTARYTPSDGWGAPDTLDGSSDGLDVVVSVGPSSNVYVSWESVDWANSSFNTTYNVTVAHYNDTLGWEPSQILAKGNVSGIQILAENDGGAVVVFAGDLMGRDVFVSRLIGPGLPPQPVPEFGKIIPVLMVSSLAVVILGFKHRKEGKP